MWLHRMNVIQYSQTLPRTITWKFCLHFLFSCNLSSLMCWGLPCEWIFFPLWNLLLNLPSISVGIQVVFRIRPWESNLWYLLNGKPASSNRPMSRQIDFILDVLKFNEGGGVRRRRRRGQVCLSWCKWATLCNIVFPPPLTCREVHHRNSDYLHNQRWRVSIVSGELQRTIQSGTFTSPPLEEKESFEKVTLSDDGSSVLCFRQVVTQTVKFDILFYFKCLLM